MPSANITAFGSASLRHPSASRLMYLLDHLDRIETAASIQALEVSMHAFTHELSLQCKQQDAGHPDAQLPSSSSSSQHQDEVTLFAKGDETLLYDLESRGALIVLLQAMLRCLVCEQTSRRYSPRRYCDEFSWGWNQQHNTMSLHHPHAQQQHSQHSQYCCISPQFFNSACIALVHLCFQSPRRSKVVSQGGGFDIIVDVMRTYRSVDYVQIIGMATLMVLGRTGSSHATESNSASSSDSHDSCHHHQSPYNNRYYVYSSRYLETVTLQEIVVALETHPENVKLYTVACSALATLFGSDSYFLVGARRQVPPAGRHIGQVDNDDDLYDDDTYNEYFHRALTAITYGVVVHVVDDPMALAVGQNLLANLVGRRVAEEMVLEMEQQTHHVWGGSFCAAAA